MPFRDKLTLNHKTHCTEPCFLNKQKKARGIIHNSDYNYILQDICCFHFGFAKVYVIFRMGTLNNGHRLSQAICDPLIFVNKIMYAKNVHLPHKIVSFKRNVNLPHKIKCFKKCLNVFVLFYT